VNHAGFGADHLLRVSARGKHENPSGGQNGSEHVWITPSPYWVKV
jgi:hypothetical protein